MHRVRLAAAKVIVIDCDVVIAILHWVVVMHRGAWAFLYYTGHEHGACNVVVFEVFCARFRLEPRVEDALMADGGLHVLFRVGCDWGSAAHLKKRVLGWRFLLSGQAFVFSPGRLVF